MTIGPDDAAYATDSALPIIYAIPSPFSRPANISLEWMKSEDFVSLQGIATTKDAKGFIVADYSMGLFFIDRATKATQRVDYAGGTTLLGIDGLIRNGNTLIAVQNGIAPARILAITLDASGNSVTGAKVLSANDPNIPEPSLGTMRADDYCVVANAQWSRFNEDGTLLWLNLRLRSETGGTAQVFYYPSTSGPSVPTRTGALEFGFHAVPTSAFHTTASIPEP